MTRPDSGAVSCRFRRRRPRRVRNWPHIAVNLRVSGWWASGLGEQYGDGVSQRLQVLGAVRGAVKEQCALDCAEEHTGLGDGRFGVASQSECALEYLRPAGKGGSCGFT